MVLYRSLTTLTDYRKRLLILSVLTFATMC